jgi:hypothetical protein
MNRTLEAALARLLGRREAPTSAAHRAALERELLARFGGLHPPREESRMLSTPLLWRSAVVAGLVLAAAGATQAPAEYQARIGTRVTLTTDAPPAREDVHAAVQAIEAGGSRLQVRVRAFMTDGGVASTSIDVLGDTVALGDVEATIRAAVPAFAAVPMTVSPIERTVEGDVGDLARRWVGAGALSPEALQQLIEEELRAAEPGADVTVEVAGPEGRRRVRVEVTKTVDGAEAPARQP